MTKKLVLHVGEPEDYDIDRWTRATSATLEHRFVERKDLHEAIRNQKPAMIHAHGHVTGVAVFHSGFKPYVISIGERDFDDMPSMLAKVFGSRSLRNASAVYVVSKDAKDAVLNAGGKGSNVVVLECGADLDLFKPKEPVAVWRERIGAKGQMIYAPRGMSIRSDRVDAAVESFPALEKHHVHAHILLRDDHSEKSNRDYVLNMARQLKTAERTTIAENTTYPDQVELFNLSSIILSFNNEPVVSSIIWDAMACGKPVIMRPALEPIIGAGGKFIDPDDIDGLSVVIRKMLQDEAGRKAMGDHNRDAALKRGSWADLNRAAVTRYQTIP